MSLSLMLWAMHVKVGSPARKMVLLNLCDNANDAGECWPSHQSIADACEISRRSVLEHISQLVKDGFLTRSKRFEDGKQLSSFYVINTSQAIRDLSTPIKPPKTNLWDGEAICAAASESLSEEFAHLPKCVNAQDILSKIL